MQLHTNPLNGFIVMMNKQFNTEPCVDVMDVLKPDTVRIPGPKSIIKFCNGSTIEGSSSADAVWDFNKKQITHSMSLPYEGEFAEFEILEKNNASN